ncbi:MAG: helix-turn-helix domain-containing protein [Paeniclostridium sordellii]|nr:helix-turn-helix domain-containing protein [Paeniclostridium sordellii]
MDRFKGLLSFSGANQKWNLKDSTLRKAVATGKLLNGIDCKKFGRDWIVTESAMHREYGRIK